MQGLNPLWGELLPPAIWENKKNVFSQCLTLHQAKKFLPSAGTVLNTNKATMARTVPLPCAGTMPFPGNRSLVQASSRANTNNMAQAAAGGAVVLQLVQ